MANYTSETIEKKLPELHKILEPHLIANHEKYIKYLERHYEPKRAEEIAKKYSKITVGHLDNGYSQRGFILNCPELFLFRMQRYPACCGAYMLYAFSGEASAECWRDLLFWIVDLLGVNPEGDEYDDDGDESVDMFMNNKRLIINMVEHRRNLPEGDRRLMDFPLIEDPKMEYQNLYDCFTKYCAKVNDRLYYNVNTGNIIHDMEVIVK
jgi:hypothetical protein